jgi:hypothetical protein
MVDRLRKFAKYLHNLEEIVFVSGMATTKILKYPEDDSSGYFIMDPSIGCSS